MQHLQMCCHLADLQKYDALSMTTPGKVIIDKFTEFYTFSLRKLQILNYAKI